MSAFFIVSSSSPDLYRKHHRSFEAALADFLRLLTEGEAEEIELKFSS